MELLFLGLGLLIFGLGLKRVLKLQGAVPGVSAANCNKGHSWEEIPVGEDLVTLKCKVCKKSLKQVLDG